MSCQDTTFWLDPFQSLFHKTGWYHCVIIFKVEQVVVASYASGKTGELFGITKKSRRKRCSSLSVYRVVLTSPTASVPKYYVTWPDTTNNTTPARKLNPKHTQLNMYLAAAHHEPIHVNRRTNGTNSSLYVTIFSLCHEVFLIRYVLPTRSEQISGQ